MLITELARTQNYDSIYAREIENVTFERSSTVHLHSLAPTVFYVYPEENAVLQFD